jgi:hypothetical protein
MWFHPAFQRRPLKSAFILFPGGVLNRQNASAIAVRAPYDRFAARLDSRSKPSSPGVWRIASAQSSPASRFLFPDAAYRMSP